MFFYVFGTWKTADLLACRPFFIVKPLRKTFTFIRHETYLLLQVNLMSEMYCLCNYRCNNSKNH